MISDEDKGSKVTEESYYDEICLHLQGNLARSLTSIGDYGIRFEKCATKDMSWGLSRIFGSLRVSNYELEMRSQLTRDLFVDIVGCAYLTKNTQASTYIICEVKLNALTLNDYAQLLGYCVTSNTEHGLLIAVNNGISSRFDSILRHNEELKCVKRAKFSHKFGILMWNTSDKEMRYNQLGYYRSLQILARALAQSINKMV